MKINEVTLNEDFGSVPPLTELILMAVVAKTSVDVLLGMFKVALKTGKGLKKLNDLRKRVAKIGQGVADYALPEATRSEILATLKDQNKSKMTQAALDALHRLVTSQGNRQSIGGYAFDIARAFNGINARELEAQYRQKFESIEEGVGKIVQGVNTTADVKPGQTEKEAKKFFGGNGKPRHLGVKGATPNQAFNLGLTEGYKLQLERDDDMYVLHITDTDSGKRTEVRGKSGYESGNYDAQDPLHQLLDKIGKASNISDLMNGEPVGINPKHPDGERSKAAADKAFNENFKDGKVKGKSRPGRVKRAGASCNGSVTELRKKAKNASGEKAKMYHWCANMKSGRKK